jgi:hypothetical protein
MKITLFQYIHFHLHLLPNTQNKVLFSTSNAFLVLRTSAAAAGQRIGSSAHLVTEDEEEMGQQLQLAQHAPARQQPELVCEALLASSVVRVAALVPFSSQN